MNDKRFEQAQAVFDILEDVYSESPWTLEQILSDMKLEHTDYFFVYDRREMVGFLSLQYLVGEIEITNIAVKSDYQGKSFGKILLSFLDKVVNPIFLEVRSSNVLAQRLYQGAGFQQIGLRKEYYHHPTEDAILMRREP